MSAPCCEHETPPAQTPAPANLARYRKILWVALIVNAALFAVEIAAGLRAGGYVRTRRGPGVSRG